MKRRGFDADAIARIKNAYKVLYRSGLKLTEATEQLQALVDAQPELRLLVDFLPRVTRSLIR